MSGAGPQIATALEEHCERVKALLDYDPRRLPEFAAAYDRLKRAEAVYFERPYGDGVHVFAMPTLKFIELYESLRLRTRLDLPTGGVADP